MSPSANESFWPVTVIVWAVFQLIAVKTMLAACEPSDASPASAIVTFALG